MGYYSWVVQGFEVVQMKFKRVWLCVCETGRGGGG